MTTITQAIGEPVNLYVPPPPPTELSVSAALRYLKLTPGASTVSICDSSANIQKNLATLQSLNGRISAIFASSEASQNLTVSYKDFAADKGVLAKWTVNANHKFDFSDVTVSNANNIWNRDFTNTVTIKDTAINIQNGFDNLNYIISRDPAKISSITQLNTALITISTSQFREGTSLLSKINKGVYNLGISNATVEDVVLPDLGTATGTELKLGYNSKVKSISIVDTTDAIDIGLDKLQRVGIKIKTIAQNNTSIDNTLELDASQIKADASVLGKIITGYQLAAQNAASTQLNNLLSNKKVISIDVVDNAANISKNWNSINSINSSVISSVKVTDGNTAAVKISASQLAVSKSLINRFSPPGANGAASFKLEVSEATASQIVDLMNSDEVTKFDIKDTSENISQHLTDLINADSNDKLNYVKTANKAQLVMDFSDYDKADTKILLAKVNKGAYNIKLTDVSVENLKELTVPNLTDRLLFVDKSIEAITLKDDGSAIESNLDLLNAAGNRLKSIEITNTLDNLLTLSAKDFINRQTVLNKIEGGYIVDLEKASIKQALSFSTNVNINTIDIEDNTQNVSAYWNRLVDMNNQLDQVSITGVAISITANQYELGLATDDDAATGVSGIDHYLTSLQGKIAGVSFAVKNASIEQALSLVSDDTNNNPAYISNIEINDNGINIGENLAQLDNLIDSHIVTKINQIDPRNAIEITHDDMVDYHNVLETIYGQGYRLSVTDVLTDDAVTLAANNKVSSISIVDNSTHIASNFDSLTSIGKKLSKIEMTDPEANISLSYSQYFKGTYVLDRINDNYFVSIFDAPLYNVSNLANNNHIKSMIVNGTSSMISRTWDVLESIGPKVVGILNTTSFSSIADAIELNINQWLNSSVVLSKFTNDSAKKFSISDAKLSDLEVSSNHDVLHDENVIAVKIRDISDVIDNFNSEDVLKALQDSKVQEISLVDSSVELSLSFSQLNVEENIDVLQKIKGGDFILNITDATVNDALSLIGNPQFATDLPPTLNVKSIHITDAAVEVVNNFDTLKSLTQLSTISLPLDDELLTLTSDRVLSSVPLLSKIASYLVDITNVSINQLIQLKSIDNSVLDTFEPIIDSPVLPNIQYYYLKDSADNFSDKYDEIISLGPNLKGLAFDDGLAHNFDVTYHQWMSSKDTLDSLVYGAEPNTSAPAPSYKFNIADISANDIVTITSDAKVNSVVVIDTADQIAANWTNLETTFNASPSKMVDMEFSDFLPLKLSVSQAIKNAGNNTSPSSLLVKVNVTNALIIKDTVSNIQAAWDDLSALYANSSGALGQLTGIELTDSERIYRSESQVASTNDQALKSIFPTGTVIVT